MTDSDTPDLTPMTLDAIRALRDAGTTKRRSANTDSVAGFLALYGRVAPMLPRHHFYGAVEGRDSIIIVSKTDLPAEKGWFDLKAQDGSITALFWIPGMEKDRAAVAQWYSNENGELSGMNGNAMDWDKLYNVLDKLGS